MFNYLLAVILLTLTACASEIPAGAPMPAQTEAPAPSEARAPVPFDAEVPVPVEAPSKTKAKAKAPQQLVSVRDFLVRGAKTPTGFAAYGYLIFSGRPSTSDEKTRYASICDAYLNKIEPKSEFANLAPQLFATTYWPITKKLKPNIANCQSIIEHYDYATAERILSISGTPKSHRGPFIVAWTIPYQQASINTKPKLILDLSTLPNEDMNYAIKLWKENVATNPDAWTQGKMNRNVILSAFRDFMKRYSDEIIKIISS